MNMRHSSLTPSAAVALCLALLSAGASGQVIKGPVDVNVLNTPSVSVVNIPSVNVVNSPSVSVLSTVKTTEQLPSRPFQRSVVGAGYRTMGPGEGGTLGVTAITLTNFSAVLQQVFVFAPVLGGGQSCGSTNVIGGSAPRFIVLVPPSQTLHLTYPTALVFGAVGGQSCVAFQGGDNMDISVNGFVN